MKFIQQFSGNIAAREPKPIDSKKILVLPPLVSVEDLYVTFYVTPQTEKRLRVTMQFMSDHPDETLPAVVQFRPMSYGNFCRLFRVGIPSEAYPDLQGRWALPISELMNSKTVSVRLVQDAPGSVYCSVQYRIETKHGVKVGTSLLNEDLQPHILLKG